MPVVQRQVVRDLEFLKQPEDALGLRMLGRAVSRRFLRRDVGPWEKGSLVRWISLTLTSMWWRVGLPSAMLLSIGREKRCNVFEDIPRRYG